MAENTHPPTLNLSIKICDLLPREIRNQIYSYLDLDQETKSFKPVDQFTSGQLCEQFSRECLLWYYENVPQMLYHPFNTEDIEYLIQNCPGAKKIPGLTIIVEAPRTEYELSLLTKAVDKLKATGYFDDLDKAFKVRICIDLVLNACWRTMNVNVEEAINTIKPIFGYFKKRTESVGCFARLMNFEEEETREDGVEFTEYMGQEMDEILNLMGILMIVGCERAFSDELRKAKEASEKRKKLLEAL